MSEQSMKCRDCVLKHLAGAISYAKEILDGHGKGGTPDHRPDYLGELVNAEHHLELLSKEILEKVSALRTAAQMKGMQPSEEDIEELRMLWVEVEDMDEHTQEAPPPKNEGELVTDKDIGILLDDPWYKEENNEKLQVFLALAGVNALHGKVIKTVDLAEYDVDHVWVFPLNVFIANPVDMRRRVLLGWTKGMRKLDIMRLVRTSDIASGPVDAPLSALVENADIEPVSNSPETSSVVYVNRKPCCNLKRRLMTEPFIQVDSVGWTYMKDFWGNLK